MKNKKFFFVLGKFITFVVLPEGKIILKKDTKENMFVLPTTEEDWKDGKLVPEFYSDFFQRKEDPFGQEKLGMEFVIDYDKDQYYYCPKEFPYEISTEYVWFSISEAKKLLSIENFDAEKKEFFQVIKDTLKKNE